MADIPVVTDSRTHIPQSILQSFGMHWAPQDFVCWAEVVQNPATAPRASFHQWLATVKELPKSDGPGSGECLCVCANVIRRKGFHQAIRTHVTSPTLNGGAALPSRQRVLLDLSGSAAVTVVDPGPPRPMHESRGQAHGH